MRIINLTQHRATDTQIQAGVVEWHDEFLGHSEWLAGTEGDPADWETRAPDDLSWMLTIPPMYDIPPSLEDRAADIAGWVDEMAAPAAMIGGHFGLTVALSEALSEALTRKGVLPLRAVTERRSVEQAQPDGSVRKVSTFEHIGFVPMLPSWWQDPQYIAVEVHQKLRGTAVALVQIGITTPAYSEYLERVFGQ